MEPIRRDLHLNRLIAQRENVMIKVVTSNPDSLDL